MYIETDVAIDLALEQPAAAENLIDLSLKKPEQKPKNEEVV